MGIGGRRRSFGTINVVVLGLTLGSPRVGSALRDVDGGVE